MAWHGMAWHGTARHGTARHCTARHGTARHGSARHGTARHGTARHGTARHGIAWQGTAWHGMAWHGTKRRVRAYPCSIISCDTVSRHSASLGVYLQYTPRVSLSRTTASREPVPRPRRPASWLWPPWPFAAKASHTPFSPS